MIRSVAPLRRLLNNAVDANVARVVRGLSGVPEEARAQRAAIAALAPRDCSAASSEGIRAMALTDEAILRIKEMILGGQHKPGDRLPREADLAVTLGLSRNSLRGAVRALALINILDVRQGDGTYVTSPWTQLLLDALTFVVDFHRDDTVLDCLRVRRILEPAAAAMAAQSVSPDQVHAAMVSQVAGVEAWLRLVR
jgi:DNA-binding GntR family transcriptional regulator